jgi:hypothetical protein
MCAVNCEHEHMTDALSFLLTHYMFHTRTHAQLLSLFLSHTRTRSLTETQESKSIVDITETREAPLDVNSDQQSHVVDILIHFALNNTGVCVVACP